MASPRGSVFSFFRQMRGRDIAAYLVVFVVCFASAKFGQYLFYTNNTSPAVIWPPFGIALGAILIGGYRMWFPVALAELFAVFSTGMSPLPVEFAAVFGQTIQPLIGAWAMNYFGFNRRLSRVWDAFILIAAALLVTMIAPLISTFTALLFHTLTTSPGLTFSRAWAGGILSILIATPFITTWFPLRPMTYTKARWIEICITLFLLVVIVIFLFWTPYAQGYGLTGIYVLLAVLVWISLRAKPRIVTLSFLLLTVLGMAGSILGHATVVPINEQLFSDELFIEFLAVIFLLFSGIVEERRVAGVALEKNILELETALKKISDEDRAKNEFIATLAHELRNPLSPVVSALELLKLQNPTPESIQTIEGAERELRMIRRLLDDLLDVARVSRNTFQLQRSIVDARELIVQCTESVKDLMTLRRHTLSVVIPKEALMLDVDSVRFRQIIINLLNNAAKYTQAGGNIDLICEPGISEASICVRDNGVGIPRESLQDIFRPFWQIRPTPQVGTGLGIGLWLTKRLVEMHGGRIEVESKGSQQGSSFTVYFPLPTKQSMENAPQLFENNTSPIPAYRILIVDDNEAAAQGLKKLLEYKGHTVDLAYTGKSGLETAQKFTPGVVLLDIGLPDMNGYEVARNMRLQQDQAILIALTGYGQEEDKLKAKDAGFDHHLTKPVGLADIEVILAKISS